MLFKFTEDAKKANWDVLLGLVGGLMVSWAFIATDEFIRILGWTNNYISKIFVSLFIALFIFIVFAITNGLMGRRK